MFLFIKDAYTVGKSIDDNFVILPFQEMFENHSYILPRNMEQKILESAKGISNRIWSLGDIEDHPRENLFPKISGNRNK